MLRFLTILIPLSMNLMRTNGSIVAKKSGIQHIERQDVGIVFYIEIKNEGKQSCAINVGMIKCCERVSPNDIDCEHMQLVGGDMGALPPRASRNVTLVWPTLYLHDRLGECVIAIGYTTKNNQTGEIREKVKFDTSAYSRRVNPVLRGYYNIGDPTKCSTVDLDTLDNCRPVNCHLKYNGKRSFFNRRQQRCQPVPICIADTRKELPDIAYVPASNTCRDLENAVNEIEVRALSEGKAEAAWRSEPLPYLPNVYCNHGAIDNATGFCVCNDGWTSKPLDNIEPSNEMIHLCNVKILPWPRLRASKLKIALMILSAFLGVSVVLFCCAMAHLMRGKLVQGDGLNCGRQVARTSSCAPSSTTRSCDSTSCSDRSPKPFQRKCKSDTSCPPKRIVRY